MAKTNAERVREYRARIRARKLPKKAPKSRLERNREWRARKKQLQNDQHLAQADHAANSADQGSSSSRTSEVAAVELSAEDAHGAVTKVPTMTNVQTQPMDAHHETAFTDNEKAMALVNDLYRTIKYIMEGVVTISSQPAKNRNGSTWIIRGPMKNLVVMLRYESDSLAEEENAGTPVSIKVEPPDEEDLQSVEENERRFVSGHKSALASFQLEKVSLNDFDLPCRTSRNFAASVVTSSTCEPSLVTKGKGHGDASFDGNVYKQTEDFGLVKRETNDDEDVTGDNSLKKAPFEVCETYLCLDATIPTVVDREVVPSTLEEESDAVLAPKANVPAVDHQNEGGRSGGNHYRCSYCDMKFYDPKKRSDHEKIHSDTPLKCSHCPKSFILSSHLKRHEKLHEAKRLHQCRSCEKSFSSPTNLKLHQVVHTGEKPHACAQCGKAFALLKTLKRHEKSHTGERNYRCSQCDKSFCLSDQLRRHEVTHRGEKPYKCSLCDMRFTRTDILKKHEKAHAGVTKCIEMGEKTHQCPYCGKLFIRLTECKQHERMHTGDRPYQCSYCDKAFSYATAFKNHERVHTGERPYKCSHCQKTFASFSSFKRHDLVHSGEKQFKCCFCDKKFLRLETLKDHERVHTGEKPYECTECGWRFTRAQQLKVHARTHKPKKTASSLPSVKTVKKEPPSPETVKQEPPEEFILS